MPRRHLGRLEEQASVPVSPRWRSKTFPEIAWVLLDGAHRRQLQGPVVLATAAKHLGEVGGELLEGASRVTCEGQHLIRNAVRKALNEAFT